MCQDTGTAIISAKKGRRVWTRGGDEQALSRGVLDAYQKKNLRYSQLAPISMFEERNTRNNLPAQVDIYAEGEDAYKFLFMAKGGGSANKTFLFQGHALAPHPRPLIAFVKEKILTLGTAACPPYHLAVVIGGTSAEMTLKTVKLASARYLDGCRRRAPSRATPSGTSRSNRRSSRRRRRPGSARSSAASISATTCASSALPRHGASLPIGSASPARRTGRRRRRSRATGSSWRSWSTTLPASCRRSTKARSAATWCATI